MMAMGSVFTRPLGYALGPPWIFKGSALYQLHLVKTEIARTFVPKELKLIDAFGYTLGGFYLAHYDDSPVGAFDELVVLAGIVGSTRNSSAWASRVFVSSNEAYIHGQQEVGLPSHVAAFSKASSVVEKQENKHRGLLSMIGLDTSLDKSMEHCNIQVSETSGSSPMSFCSISLPGFLPNLSSDKWLGPMLKFSLPNFSGRTVYNPNLLEYSCQMECRVRIVEGAKVSAPSSHGVGGDRRSSEEDEARDGSLSIMMSKPILALKFDNLKMRVEAPTVVAPQPP